MRERREPLSGVAEPRQARSQQALQRLLDAAEALAAEKGLADASIPEIVRRGRSSVGGFYARFRDKNALLRALEERFFAELDGRLEALAAPERWRLSTLPVLVAACADELVSVVSSRHHLLLLRRDALRHPQPELAIDLGVQSAMALMLQHVLYGETRAAGRTLSHADLVREITRSFLAYLGAPGALEFDPAAGAARR